MKSLNLLISSIFSLLLILLTPSSTLAQADVSDLEKAASESALVQVISNQITTDSSSDQVGPHFRAGENVVIANEYIGDVYAAAGSVQVPGTIDGDLLVAGGTISIDGTVTQDLRVAGGTVIVNGQIGGNVTVMGGNITFSQASNVGGSVVVFGGSVSLLGTVEGNVYGGAGNVSMSGTVGNNMVFDSGSLRIPATASISGSLTARVSESSDVDPASKITGSQDIKLVQHSKNADVARKDAKAFAGIGIFSKFVFGSLMAIVGGSVLFALFPKFFKSTAEVVKKETWVSVGWGIAISFLTPILFIFLLITVVGIPLAFITLLIWIVAIICASWMAMYVVGGWIAEKTQANWLSGKYAQLIVGVLSVELIGLVPVFGWIFKYLVYAVGMGAIFLWLKAQMRRTT